MQRQVRQNLIKNLWESYQQRACQVQVIANGLKQKGINNLVLDHFAMIDLPGPYTGINYLSQIFSAFGYVTQGKNYLASKQNDFAWMAEPDCLDRSAHDVLPQVVVADFRLDELPAAVRKIIRKYAAQASPLPIDDIRKRMESIMASGNVKAVQPVIETITRYLNGRDWALPSRKEFYTVQEFNRLLAWVLIYGRRPNHFTLSIHLLDYFHGLADFNQFVTEGLQLELNQEGGLIKGSAAAGIAQSSTTGVLQKIKLCDGEIELPSEFVEFIWRYPKGPAVTSGKKALWKDYVPGFIAEHANHVIESLSVPPATPEYHHTHRGQNDCW